MAKPILLQNNYSGGMRRDLPRNRMPTDSAWTLKDVILEYGAPARERGGWEHYSASVTAATASIVTAGMRGGIYAVFSSTAGAQNLVVASDGTTTDYLVNITTPASPTLIPVGGAVASLFQNPVYHGGASVSGSSATFSGLVIIPWSGGLGAVKYNGVTASALNGSPPKARYATVYKDYTVLGHGSVPAGTFYPNRIWFSPPGDPDCSGSSGLSAWDITDSWIDFSLPVRGLASTKNTLLVFGDGQVSRVRGSISPPDTDMVVDDPWQKIGLLGAHAITVHEDIVYWCAPEGVFRSDGVYLDNITAKGGMLRYWLDMVDDLPEGDFVGEGALVATGIIRNKLVISVINGTDNTVIDGFLIDLQTYAWTRLGNFDARAIWDGSTELADDLFFSRRGSTQVGRLGSIFDVSNSSFKNDGDGDAVASVVETPFYEMGRPGIKTVKGIHVGFQLTDHGSDNPTIAAEYITSPEQTSYTSLGTLSETTAYDRKRLQLGGRFYGLGFKFTRANAGDFLGYDLSAEVGFQEESKRMT